MSGQVWHLPSQGSLSPSLAKRGRFCMQNGAAFACKTGTVLQSPFLAICCFPWGLLTYPKTRSAKPDRFCMQSRVRFACKTAPLLQRPLAQFAKTFGSVWAVTLLFRCSGLLFGWRGALLLLAFGHVCFGLPSDFLSAIGAVITLLVAN